MERLPYTHAHQIASEGAFGSGTELDAAPLHHDAVVLEALKVVALMHGGETVEGIERSCPGCNTLFTVKLSASVACVASGLGDRQGNQLGRMFQVPHREADVAPPHVRHRRSAAVVGGVHPEEVFLFEVEFQRQDPVGTIAVGAALVRPEGGLFRPSRRDRIAVVGPAFDLAFALPDLFA